MAEKKEPISDDMEEIGANIKRYRKQKKLTLEQLADNLGGSYSAMGV
ncbi:MAG: helix-turn-helix domain-containing protein [Clostridiales bacterium]|nr:helix-turn-helix domain-containing protein [Clostridiales bacterium]